MTPAGIGIVVAALIGGASFGAGAETLFGEAQAMGRAQAQSYVEGGVPRAVGLCLPNRLAQLCGTVRGGSSRSG